MIESFTWCHWICLPGVIGSTGSTESAPGRPNHNICCAYFINYRIWDELVYDMMWDTEFLSSLWLGLVLGGDTELVLGGDTGLVLGGDTEFEMEGLKVIIEQQQCTIAQLSKVCCSEKCR